MTSRSRTPTQQSAPAWRQLKHCPIVRVFAGRSSSAGTQRSCHSPSPSNDRFTLVAKGAAHIALVRRTLGGYVMESPTAEGSCKPEAFGKRMQHRTTKRLVWINAPQPRICAFSADLQLHRYTKESTTLLGRSSLIRLGFPTPPPREASCLALFHIFVVDPERPNILSDINRHCV